MADNEWVLMEHPNLPKTKENPPRVRRRSFDLRWSQKGWTEHKPAGTKAAAKTAPKAGSKAGSATDTKKESDS